MLQNSGFVPFFAPLRSGANFSNFLQSNVHRLDLYYLSANILHANISTIYLSDLPKALENGIKRYFRSKTQLNYK